VIGHCHTEQVAVFDRGEARLRHWNRLVGHSTGSDLGEKPVHEVKSCLAVARRIGTISAISNQDPPSDRQSRRG
jgi:hypothetical protein